ncbi:hypothetical protein [Alkalibacterium sp. 20]|uniref:hypothetical protein n=1 Tax=Alkalibacterium sp. 20 TaxID=1798803 RepID=UPI00090000D3|nr:hypothetical protein [Alkalibacterium sp. 20]OJF94204.1 hypothetical protein AX762_07800 [Alkalibacterium sp. 20]
MKLTKQKYSLNLSTGICLFGSLLVILKMMTGSQIFLILFLILVSIGIINDKIENKILYILYFVPWAYVIKFYFNQMSLITVLSALYCVVVAVYILLYKTRISIFYIITIVSVFIYSFFSLLINSSASTVSILSFLLNFVVIYFATLFVLDKKVIPHYILFHALGLTVSGGVSFLGNSIPAIENYITSFTVLHTMNTTDNLYTRFTGLDMDPNYFSIQVLIAIACLLIIVFSNQVKLTNNQKVLSYIYIFILSIMGLLTFSKMFIISFAVLIISVLIILLKDNIKQGLYYLLSFSSVLGLTTYIFYDFFYQAYFFRFFSEGNNASSITSGRSAIWLSYYYEITSNPQILFIGDGISDHFFNDKLSHNMYLIAWYYLGIVGLLVFMILFIALYIQLKNNLNVKSSFSILSLSSIPLFIIVFANFSLDSFVMDYFGVHVFLVILTLVLGVNDSPELLAKAPIKLIAESS